VSSWSGPGEGERLWFLGTMPTIKLPGELFEGRFALIEFLFPRAIKRFRWAPRSPRLPPVSRRRAWSRKSPGSA
jgi:hypothetical protein